MKMQSGEHYKIPGPVMTETIHRASKKLTCLYGLCGFLAFSVDQVLNWEFMIQQEKTISALVIAVPIAGLLCAIAWPAIWICLKRRDIPSALLFVFVFISLALFSLGASINRSGESYDNKIHHLQRENQARLLALQSLKEAKIDWVNKDRVVQDELNKGGCGRICKDKKTNALEAYNRLQKMKNQVEKRGTIISVDPLARRIASLFNFQEKWVQLIYPLLLPIGIWLASIGFIGAALNELSHKSHKQCQNSDYLPLEKKIFDWMLQQQRQFGRLPTQKEAAQYFGISESTVSRKLAEMKSSASG